LADEGAFNWMKGWLLNPAFKHQGEVGCMNIIFDRNKIINKDFKVGACENRYRMLVDGSFKMDWFKYSTGAPDQQFPNAKGRWKAWFGID